LLDQAVRLNSWDMTPRQICDIELLLNGAFSPLSGFLNRSDYESVVTLGQLADGQLWPMPINLDVDIEYSKSINVGETIVLRDPEGLVIPLLDIEDIWQPDKLLEAEQVFGTTDKTHPGADYLFNTAGPIYVGGKLRGIELPAHHDYHNDRHTPNQLRAIFEEQGWQRVVAFQTRNPLHRAHQELTLRAIEEIDGNLLIHPVVGMTKPGDIDHHTRVKCYSRALASYKPDSALISLLPLAMRMGGPREALWHALIRKNYGCTHFIVGRDHAGPGKDASGKPFYHPDAARDYAIAHENRAGIKILSFDEMVYSQKQARYLPINEAKPGEKLQRLSGTDLRELLNNGDEIPSWFTLPGVAAELRKAHPPLEQQGFVLFFTGLSGSGKSTLANIVETRLLELTGRRATMLDGDLVRKHLSAGLGFSREDRDRNILRIAFVAGEVVKHRGIAICAPIAPYSETRKQARDLVSQYGQFIEIHLATGLEICEQRDRKGLYAKARAGIIKGFTGIDDPYEEPVNPEIRIDTANYSAAEGAELIVEELVSRGFVSSAKQKTTQQLKFG
jgi:sulfate adenylyltransferase